ncbi:MAG: alpha/beta fold hydrolase [Gilvibacter sp.]
MIRFSLYLLLFICSYICFGQTPNFESIDLKVSPLIEGTLLRPADQSQVPLVIIVQGSGPTDRNGNQPMMENNSLKMLAEALKEHGIASYRYDKRIVPMIKNRTLNEASLSFDDFVQDASDALNYFKRSDAFSGYYLIGHSQGGLIVTVVAQEGVDGVISIAGAGQSIDAVIVDQLERQAPGLAENAQAAFNDLRETGEAKKFSPGLVSIFRPPIQPFMRSWMLYDPKAEIAKVTAPVLIINGTKDLQVNEAEAAMLKEANPAAQLEIIEGMNHILKNIEGSDAENGQSYNNPQLPLHAALIGKIAAFIKN